jgi:hypothetical protein
MEGSHFITWLLYGLAASGSRKSLFVHFAVVVSEAEPGAVIIPRDVRGSRLLAERSSCRVAKRLPSKMCLRQFRAVNAEGTQGVAKNDRARQAGEMSSGVSERVLAADLQSLAIHGVCWHARC